MRTKRARQEEESHRLSDEEDYHQSKHGKRRREYETKRDLQFSDLPIDAIKEILAFRPFVSIPWSQMLISLDNDSSVKKLQDYFGYFPKEGTTPAKTVHLLFPNVEFRINSMPRHITKGHSKSKRDTCYLAELLLTHVEKLCIDFRWSKDVRAQRKFFKRYLAGRFHSESNMGTQLREWTVRGGSLDQLLPALKDDTAYRGLRQKLLRVEVPGQRNSLFPEISSMYANLRLLTVEKPAFKVYMPWSTLFTPARTDEPASLSAHDVFEFVADKMPQLRNLRIIGYVYTPESFQMLVTTHRHLEEFVFDLSKNSAMDQLFLELGRHIFSGIELNTSLRRIHVVGGTVPLQAQDLQTLAKNSKLRHLTFESIRFDTQCEKLLPSLSITSLCLLDVNIEAIPNMVELLLQMQQLENLSVGDAVLDVVGLSHLLKESKNLKQLNYVVRPQQLVMGPLLKTLVHDYSSVFHIVEHQTVLQSIISKYNQ